MLKHRIVNYDKLNSPADWNLTPAMVVSYIEFLCPCCYYIGIDLIIRIDNGLNILLTCCMSLLLSSIFQREKERRDVEWNTN